MKNTLVFLFFFMLSIFMISGIVFDSRLIGRSLDATVPPVNHQLHNPIFQTLFTWWSNSNGGVHNSFILTLLPINLLLYFPVLIGINSPWFIQRFQIVVTLFLALSFFYLLSQKILDLIEAKGHHLIKLLVAILTSIFFVFNSYFFTDISFGSNVIYATYSFVPLALYGFLKYIAGENKKLSFLIVYLSLIIIGSTLQRLVLIYALLFLLSLFYSELKFFLKVIIAHLLTSLYWILPLIMSLSTVKSLELSSDYTSGLTTGATKFIPALINMDYFGNRDLYRIALGNDIAANIWFVNSFLLLLLIFYCLFRFDLFSKNVKKLVFIFSFVLLISVLFIKGANEPFGDLVLWLYKKFPLLNIYRSLQHYIGFYVIAASILFLISTFYLVKKNYWLLGIIITMILINSAPWWMTRNLGISNISRKKIPTIGLFNLTPGNEKFYNLSALPEAFSLFTIPPGHSLNFLSTDINQTKTQGTDAGLVYNNKPSFATESQMGDFKPVLEYLEKEAYVNDDFFNQNEILFKLLNVGFFIIRDDVSPDFSKHKFSFNTDKVKISAAKSPFLAKVSNNDWVSIYKNKSFLALVYIPDRLIISDVEVNSLPNLLKNNELSEKPLVILSSQNSNLKELSNLSAELKKGFKSKPQIHFTKNNPTKLTVNIKNAPKVFTLVASFNFNNMWKLYPGSIFKKPLDEKFHFKANGFSNTWLIDADYICSNFGCSKNPDNTFNYYFTIEYFGQRFVYTGFIFSGIMLILTLYYYIPGIYFSLFRKLK